jgi:uncharacterized membrane protein
MGRSERRPFGRMNHRNRRAPGIAAALIGRRCAGVIVITALCGFSASRDMGMIAIRRVIRVALRGHDVIVILRSRLHMPRPAACGKRKGDGDSKDDWQAAFHAGGTIVASGPECNDGRNAAKTPHREPRFAAAG